MALGLEPRDDEGLETIPRRVVSGERELPWSLDARTSFRIDRPDVSRACVLSVEKVKVSSAKILACG